VVRKFGKLIAILLATGGVSLLVPIAVYADAPTPVNHAVVNDQHSETVVTNTSSSNVTTGTSGDNTSDGIPSGSVQDTNSTVQTSKTVTTGTTSGSDTSDQSLTSDKTSVAVTSTSNDGSGTAMTPTASTAPAEQVVADAVTTNAHIATALRASAAQTLVNTGQPASAPSEAPASQPASNHQLPPVQGALQGLTGALATFVVPQTAKLFGFFQAAHDFRTTSTAPIQATLVIILTVLVGSFFVDFLRRSGYHGAARGDDVHSALLSFATPGKVDVIWATKPSYTATFLVSEIKAVTQRF